MLLLPGRKLLAGLPALGGAWPGGGRCKQLADEHTARVWASPSQGALSQLYRRPVVQARAA